MADLAPEMVDVLTSIQTNQNLRNLLDICRKSLFRVGVWESSSGRTSCTWTLKIPPKMCICLKTIGWNPIFFLWVVSVGPRSLVSTVDALAEDSNTAQSVGRVAGKAGGATLSTSG